MFINIISSSYLWGEGGGFWPPGTGFIAKLRLSYVLIVKGSRIRTRARTHAYRKMHFGFLVTW